MKEDFENPDSLKFEMTDSSTIFVDRIEDGYVFFEHVIDREVVDRDVVDEKHVPEDIFEGSVVSVNETETGLDFELLLRETGEKHNKIYDKIKRLGIDASEL